MRNAMGDNIWFPIRSTLTNSGSPSESIVDRMWRTALSGAGDSGEAVSFLPIDVKNQSKG